jgi:uncharacterized repeat protein (TIGR01451 family)
VRCRSRLFAAAAAVALSCATAGVVSSARSGAATVTSCSGTPKCYTAALSPSSVITSSSDAFTLTLTNESPLGTTPLGSVNLTAPTGFTITGAGSLPPCPTPLSGSPPCATISGNVLELRDLNIQPQSSASFAFTANAPSTAGTYTWPIAAKQSNDFNGTGNDFTYDTATPPPTTTVTPPPAQADLSVSFPVPSNPNPVTTGNDTLYTINVSNTTPAGAAPTSTNVSLTDTVSSGSTIVQDPSSGSSAGWTCSSVSTTQSSCSYSNLPAGSTVTLTVAVQAPSSAGTMTDTASVSGSATDPNSANNTATQSTTVETAPSNSNTASGYCPNTGCTISSGSEPNASVPTVGAVTFPPFSGSGFTYSFSLAGASFCSPTGGVQCTGSALNLGNLPSGFSTATSPIVVDVKYDSSITPGGLTTADAFKCTTNCSTSGATGTAILACTIAQIAQPDPCVNSESRDSSGALDVQILMLSGDPWVGNIYIP